MEYNSKCKLWKKHKKPFSSVTVCGYFETEERKKTFKLFVMKKKSRDSFEWINEIVWDKILRNTTKCNQNDFQRVTISMEFFKILNVPNEQNWMDEMKLVSQNEVAN